MNRTFFVWNIGCQMNAADAHRVAERLHRLGMVPATAVDRADVIVLNSCVVRQSAEDKVWGRLSSIKPIKRQRPGAFVALMGCAVPNDTTSLSSRFPFVDAFVRPSDVDGLIEAVTRRLEAEACPVSESAILQPVSRGVTAIEGCNHHCTYCIVRLRRGPEVSRPLKEVTAEARRAVEGGAREIVLLGQNVDAYGRDLAERLDLADLLCAVHDIEAVSRIRFLTSHPSDMSDRVIDAVAGLPKVCEQFELPVQSGDDYVLQRMGRTHTADQYRRLVERIRCAVPSAAIATDVIVGFPGETDEQFERTRALLEELRFDSVHVAMYSPRPGTAAARLEDDVPRPVKEERRREVEAIQERIVGEINGRLLGQSVEMLVEDRHKGKWRGRTRTGKWVFFEGEGDWRGRLAEVGVTWAGPWSLLGNLRTDACTQ